jgi:hypothetical protein
LYLDLVGVVAMEDMKNTAVVVSAVVSMESTIKMLPGAIKFDFSS